MKTIKTNRLTYIPLLLGITLFVGAIILTLIGATQHTEEFGRWSSIYRYLPIILLITAFPLLIAGLSGAAAEGAELTTWDIIGIYAMIFFFLSIGGLVVTTLITDSRANDAITTYLNEKNLYELYPVSPDQMGEKYVNGPNLADLTVAKSAVIVDGPTYYDYMGDMHHLEDVKISNLNSLLPDEMRAYGAEKLRYVIIVDEILGQIIKSEKWQAQYQRGFEVGEPFSVAYHLYNWDMAVFDLESGSVISRTMLYSSAPSDYNRPLSSSVEIRPSEDALKILLVIPVN